MKKIIIILMAASLAGCSKKFLDKNSLTQIASENFWQSESDAQLGINGIYDALQDRALYSGNLNAAAGLPMFDCFGDNSYNNYKWEGPGNFMVGILTPTDNMISSLWASSYKGIARANAAIENIDKMPLSVISQDKKDGYFGQALFLRALFYFNLEVYYGDVPLITKVQSLDQAYVPKNTYAEVNTQIIADLKDAINKLPLSYPSTQYGYATKGAALGLLARVYLYNKDYQGVLDATATLLTLGYTLNSSYSQLFTEAGENSKEVVFSVRFNQDVSNNGETFSGTYLGNPAVDKLPMPNLVNDYYCTDGKPISTSPLYNSSNKKANRDPRLSASVYFKNDTFLIDTHTKFAGNVPTGYGQKKYIRNLATSVNGVAAYNPGGQDFYIIRYSDVLLMRAEALIESNQLTAEVYSLIDQVRQRVNMPKVEDVEGSSLTQAQLRDVLRHERRVELAFEGLRYFDLKRWGKVSDGFNRAIADAISGYTPVYSAKSEVFPIPQSELDVNTNLVQNTIWQ